MTKVTITQAEYDKMQRDISKLRALESGGVDNWEWYGESLKEWNKENEIDELLDSIIETINDVLIEADVEQPAGRGCGYSITFDEAQMKRLILDHLKEYKEIA